MFKRCIICDSITFGKCSIHDTTICNRCKNMYDISCPMCDTSKLDNTTTCFRCKFWFCIRDCIKCKRCKQFCCIDCITNTGRCERCNKKFREFIHYLSVY